MLGVLKLTDFSRSTRRRDTMTVCGPCIQEKTATASADGAELFGCGCFCPPGPPTTGQPPTSRTHTPCEEPSPRNTPGAGGKKAAPSRRPSRPPPAVNSSAFTAAAGRAPGERDVLSGRYGARWRRLLPPWGRDALRAAVFSIYMCVAFGEKPGCPKWVCGEAYCQCCLLFCVL